MRQRFWQAILGISLLLGVSGAAVADFVYTLDTNNIAIPGPIGTATVHLIDSTHASVTFLANNPTFNYWFSDGGAVAVNVNAATWIATATGNCAIDGNRLCPPDPEVVVEAEVPDGGRHATISGCCAAWIPGDGCGAGCDTGGDPAGSGLVGLSPPGGRGKHST